MASMYERQINMISRAIYCRSSKTLIGRAVGWVSFAISQAANPCFYDLAASFTRIAQQPSW